MEHASPDHPGAIVYDPKAPDQNKDPWPTLRALRAHDPAHWSDLYDMWIVTRYDDVKSGMSDHEVFSSRTPNTGQVTLCPEAMKALAGCPVVPPTLVTADPPVQSNNRRPVQRALSARRIRAMEPHVREIAVELVGRFGTGGTATELEFVSAFAGPLPVRVVAELLGVPRADHAQFKVWADDLTLGLSAGLSEEEQVRSATSMRDVQAYFLRLISQRRSTPTDDLASELTAAVRPDGTPFSDLDLLSIFIQFVVAGHETTTNLIAGMMLIVAKHPEIAADLRRDHALHEGFIDEALRYFTPVQGRFRVATRDAEIAGRRVAAGDRVKFHYGAANQDEKVFPDPDQFQPRRPNASSHVAFGHGIHHCIGSELAKVEARVALDVLITHLSDIRMADDELHWADHFHLRGLTSLRLQVSATAAA